MGRRCSHCSHKGHNSRTCPLRGGGGFVKLFGVRLTDGSIIKKSASMGNLSAHYHSSSSAAAAAASPNPTTSPSEDPIPDPDGYLSDDPAHATNRRKKGVPWTEEEHRLFLLGLQKLGKGDWRGISRNFVMSRTPTQVASHAQKYFIRHSNATRRKRRSSLFDMVPEMGTDLPPVPEEQFMLPPSRAVDTDPFHSLPLLNLSLNRDFEHMEATSDEKVKGHKETAMASNAGASAFFPAHLPVPFPLWPPNTAPLEEESAVEMSRHQVLRPIPLLPKEPVNVDELVGMSQLSLGETELRGIESSTLCLNLFLGAPSRRSAFHASAPVNRSYVSKGKSNAIQAV